MQDHGVPEPAAGAGTTSPEADEGWRLLFERNPLPMWIFDDETLGFLAVNEAAVTKYGWTTEEFLGMRLQDIRPPDEVPGLLDDLKEHRAGLHGGRAWRHRLRSGEIIHVDSMIHHLPFRGRPAALAVVRDITSQVRATEALASSEARWERLFAASGTGIAEGNLQGLLTRVNPAFCELVGRQQVELLGQPLLGFTHPEDAPDCRRQLDRLARGELDTVSIEKRYLRPDGTPVWAQAVVTLTPGDDSADARRFVAVLLDIDQRRKSLQALRASEERFRNVARATADAVWDWDLRSGTLWWSEGLKTLFGLDPADLDPGLAGWSEHIHPEDLAEVRAGLDAALQGGADRWQGEYRFRCADGRYALVIDRGFVIREADGQPLRMVGGMTDQSAQRAAEQRLARQADLLDAARDAIIVHDLDQHILYWSSGAARLFGWASDQALQQRRWPLLQMDEGLAAEAQAEAGRRGEWAGVLPCLCQDGRKVAVDARLSVLRDAVGQPEAILAIMTDVTRRLALEAQLNQSQRLEALGQLTGGVAHDFNNLLTVIQGNAELLAEQLDAQPVLRSLAQMAVTAAERGAQLTQRLLAFARKQPLQPQSVDAYQLLSGMDTLLRRTLPADIELELVRGAGLWPMLADPVQLESSVLNLVLNARDAMPEGGKITLETTNSWIDQDYAERHPDVLPGQYVMISVSDTGTGMDAQALAHAFEPFYTTKAVGKGTGLGLSMVYGFAKQSQGHVKLYSEPGQGTTVRLYLPRADSRSETVARAPSAGTDLRGDATVLVVEDDDPVRRFATEVLRNLGYQVLSAENGAAALAILKERADIALLFTDVVMPGGMNGRQLADAALLLRPGLKVLFTSGYTENAIVHHGRLDRGVQLLAKPYRAVDLARKLKMLLA